MKRLLCILILVILSFTLSGCNRCEHKWADATCVTPRTCLLCDKTKGKVNDNHSWADANCISPKTCSLCGITEGIIADKHDWLEATCIAPKTCSLCGKTEGTVSDEHDYEGLTCKLCNTTLLTIWNYEDYLECSATVKVGDYLSWGDFEITSVDCNFDVVGNSHYKYEDVVLTVKFTHYDRLGIRAYYKYILGSSEEKPTPYEERTLTVKLSLAGNGWDRCSISTPWYDDSDWYSDVDNVFDSTMYELVNVTGTVKPY